MIPSEVRNFRWPILILCCLMVAGKYYSFDIPAAVYDKLEDRFHDYGGDFVLDFNLMYTFYCFPNIFLPLFGGHLVDKFGQRTMIVIFTTCSFMGQFIVSFGVTSRNFNLILFGRFIFGLGESLNISIITILSSYFAQGELAFAFIVLFLSTRFCTFLNLLMSPIFEFDRGVSSAFWIGTLICSFGVMAALILAEVDDVIKSPYSNLKSHSSTLDIGLGTHVSGKSQVFGSYTSSLKTKPSVPSPLPMVREEEDIDDRESDEEKGNSAESIVARLKHKQEGYGTFSGVQSVEDLAPEGRAQDLEDDTEDCVVSAPKTSRKTLYCIFLLCFFLYGAILPFYDMANPIIHIGYFHTAEMKHMDSHEKELWITRLQSIPIVMMALFAPCIGVVVDYYGHRPSFFVVAATLLVFSHCIIATRLGDLTYLIVALIMIGIAHALTVAVTWTCVQYLVSPSQQGFATGVLLSIYHLSQSLIPIVVSFMITTEINFIDSHVSKHKYVALELIDIRNCEAFFVVMAIVAIFFSLILFIFDESGNAELRLSGFIGSHDYDAIENSDDEDVESENHPSASSYNYRSDPPASILTHRQRSKSLSDSSPPLTSCLKKHNLKGAVKGKTKMPSEMISISYESQPLCSDGNGTDSNDDDHGDSSSGDEDYFAERTGQMQRRNVSFAGDCDFTPERRAGQGQHPPILPLNIKMPQPPPSPKRMMFAHF